MDSRRLPHDTFPVPDDLTVAGVHTVCCDVNVGLCGTLLPASAGYVDDDAPTCVLCALAEQLGRPCGAPGCEVGLPPVLAELQEFIPLGRCAVCGCTDEESCPGGCRWVADDLCSACAPGGRGDDDGDEGPDPDPVPRPLPAERELVGAGRG